MSNIHVYIHIHKHSMYTYICVQLVYESLRNASYGIFVYPLDKFKVFVACNEAPLTNKIKLLSRTKYASSDRVSVFNLFGFEY